MRVADFVRVAREWNPGGVAVQSRREFRRRLKACEVCRWRAGLICPLIHCRCRIASYALDRSNDCPTGRWDLLRDVRATDGPID
jgi:hypothetical protein